MEKEVKIDGVVYVPKSQPACDLEGMEYKIVRTYSAGVFAGYIEEISEDNKLVTVRNARRIHRWAGAASLSQLAMEGTKDPQNCRFPCEVDRLKVTEAIEILDVTRMAQESIASVPVWEEE